MISAREGDRKPCVLFVDYAFPMYDRYAGSRANFMYLTLLAQMGLQVIFLPADFQRIEPYASELEALGIQLLVGKEMESKYGDWLEENGSKIDYVFFNKPEPTIKFLASIRASTSAAIIYQCHDLHYLRIRRKAYLDGDQDTMNLSLEFERLEDQIFRECDVILTFSSEELKILQSRYPYKPIISVPLFFYDKEPVCSASWSERSDILFVGSSSHSPNEDAVIWFCSEILPVVRRDLPHVRVKLVGASPSDRVRRLRSDHVEILESASDEQLAALYSKIRLSIVPLRFGAGVKGKTIESLHQGVPLVSTSVGLEGMVGVDGFLSPHDHGATFAAEVVSLYNDEDRWTRISRSGAQWVGDHFMRRHAAGVLDQVFDIADDKSRLRHAAADLRCIAFFLPQFHPIAENDEWWGAGFTEWRNVAKATPLFPGHYQPHLPADLGFYDLRLKETLVEQSSLAKAYGVHGFCFYHYWFNGRRLLERPVEQMLLDPEPNFPFCLCWANENWTRRWDGEDQQILMKMDYSEEDDRVHLQDLTRAFTDERYIRVDGKPLFLVYKTENLPDPARTAQVWREEARRAGIGELYLVRVESTSSCDPATIGFDAAVEFAPDWSNKGERRKIHNINNQEDLGKIERDRIDQVYRANYVHYYDDMVKEMLSKPHPPYKWMRCATPSWDNSPRRKEGAHIFLGSTPEKYRSWLTTIVQDAKERLREEERLIFVNGWNEWAEGNHLEPDARWGHAYLEATRDALVSTLRSTNSISESDVDKD